MEFTKEQVEYLIKQWDKERNDTSGLKNVFEFFKSLVKPERKKIVVEIEYDEIGYKFPLGLIEGYVKNYLNQDRNLKFTELPEWTWTDEDMIEFAKEFTGHNSLIIKGVFDKFKDKKKSDLDK